MVTKGHCVFAVLTIEEASKRGTDHSTNRCHHRSAMIQVSATAFLTSCGFGTERTKQVPPGILGRWGASAPRSNHAAPLQTLARLRQAPQRNLLIMAAAVGLPRPHVPVIIDSRLEVHMHLTSINIRHLFRVPKSSPRSTVFFHSIERLIHIVAIVTKL